MGFSFMPGKGLGRGRGLGKGFMGGFSGTAGGPGTPAPPPPVGCTYPLDASAAELSALGIDGKLTMSGGDQTFSYTADGSLASSRAYGAGPDGLTTGSADTLDLSSGIVAFEFSDINLLTGGAQTTGVTELAIQGASPAMSFLFQIGQLATFSVFPSGSPTGVDAGPALSLEIGTDLYVFDETSSLGIYFDASSAAIGYSVYNCTRYDASGGSPWTKTENYTADLGLQESYTPGQAALVVAISENTNTSAVGDCGATLIFDAADMQCTYPAGTVDKCGTTI